MNHAIQTAPCWDESARSYVENAEPFTSQYCRDAVELARIEPGMSLLDVATGPGALALAAAEAGASVTAVDFSAAMIAQLAARVGTLPVTALQMDGQALDLPDGSFDRACSVFGIPLFRDWRAGLKELARVLRPGGLAVVGVADSPFGFGPNVLLLDARAELCPGDPPPPIVEGMEALADQDKLTSELHKAGFGEVVVHSRTHDFIVGAQHFSGSTPLLANSPMLAGLSDADGAAVLTRAQELGEARRDGDSLRIPGTAFLAVATRA